MRMKATLLIAAAGVALAACVPTERTVINPVSGQCNAEDARSLIGSHVGAVTFASDAEVRIVCTTCPTTKDLRPDRLNVRFDQQTGIIQSVDCG